MAKTKTDAVKKLTCPLCLMMEAFESCAERHEGVMKHIRAARIEFLEGVKSLVESQIDDLRKKNKGGSGFKKIEVTE